MPGTSNKQFAGNNYDYNNSLMDGNRSMLDQSQAFAGAKIQQGPITLPSGAVYEGEWRNELREGFGR